MSKTFKIKQFIADRLSQIDQEYENSTDPMKKIKLSTMRTSFANIMNVYLSENRELGVSYLKHAQTYYKSNCFEQAIYYSQLAKKHSKNSQIVEEALLLNLNCLLKLDKIEEASDLIKEAAVEDHKKKEFFQVKAEIMERMKNEDQTFEVMALLGEIISEKFTMRSVEMGLHLIEKGRKKGSFDHYEEALEEMQKGLNVLIEVKYRENMKTSKVYIQMADFHRKLNNLESEYSCLICALSMMRQIPNMQKELIELMHKIVVNLTEREDYEGSMKELLKIEALEKHIYGESSSIVGRTIKKISDTLCKMNRKMEAKKYDQEYSRIISCNERKGMSREKPLKYVQIKNHH